MIDEVGEVLPLREEYGYLEAKVPATDMAEEGIFEPPF
jgi:hypothetical protein